MITKRVVVSIANYAVLYTFSPETSGWEKADVEGTLFICACMPEYIGESHLHRSNTAIMRSL